MVSATMSCGITVRVGVLFDNLTILEANREETLSKCFLYRRSILKKCDHNPLEHAKIIRQKPGGRFERRPQLEGIATLLGVPSPGA